MDSVIVEKILQRINQPDLLRLLSDELSGTELNSLLLAVFKKRVHSISPVELLKAYEANRFVKPSDLPVVESKAEEHKLLEFFQRNLFEPIELSPVSVLGACSVVATADQDKILTALRGTEVLADATNAIALHVSYLKKNKLWLPESAAEVLNFSTIQRHIRTQPIPKGSGFTPHFKIGCLVTCGTDSGNLAFEREGLLSHINLMTKLFREYYKVDDIRFRFLCRSGYESHQDLAERVRDHVVANLKGCVIDIVKNPEKEIDYYKGIQYKVDIKVKGKTWEIGDGGFVDWTQQLLGKKKERMLSTGFGFDLMQRIYRGEL